MVIQGKATPAILRDVLRAEVGPDDAAGLRDALVYTCELLERQDRRLLDLHHRLQNLEAFVHSMNDDLDEVITRLSAGPGGWNGELRLVYVPRGADVKVSPRPRPTTAPVPDPWPLSIMSETEDAAF